jgi:hypothetical protein
MASAGHTKALGYRNAFQALWHSGKKVDLSTGIGSHYADVNNRQEIAAAFD